MTSPPAAYDTITAHLRDLAIQPEKYDLIVTGDLGALGAEIVTDLLARDGHYVYGRYNDCGLMIYDRDTQDVHAGGSGCGCAGSVLAGHIIPGMRDGMWNNVLFCATGAMLSPLTTQQGESVPGICYAVALSNKRG